MVQDEIDEKEASNVIEERDAADNENDNEDENLLPIAPVTRICNESLTSFIAKKGLSLKTMFSKDAKDALRQVATTIITYIVSSINPQKKKTLTPEMIVEFAGRSGIDGFKEALEAHQKKLPIPPHPLLLGRTTAASVPKEITESEQKTIVSNFVKAFDSCDMSVAKKCCSELTALVKGSEELKKIMSENISENIIEEMKKVSNTKIITNVMHEMDDDDYDEDMYDDDNA